MKNIEKKLLLSLGDIDEKYLEQARPRKNSGHVNRAIVIAASLVLVVGISLWAVLSGMNLLPSNNGNGDNVINPGFSSVIKEFLMNPDTGSDINIDGGVTSPGEPDDTDLNGSYMEVTDNQISGIVEGDYVKATDKYLFRLGDHTIYIYSINGEKSELVSTFTIPFIEGEGSYARNYGIFLSDDGRTVTLFRHHDSDLSKTMLMSIDVSDVKAPKEKGRVFVNGLFRDVRRIDGKFYLFTSCSFEKNRIDFDDPFSFIPSIDFGDSQHLCDSNKIVYPDKLSNVSYKYLTVFAEDLTLTDEMALMVSGNPVFTENSIVFEYRYYKNETDGDKSVNRCYTKFGVLDRSDGLTWRGDFSVLGWTRNRYSIDERDGALRIVTSVSDRAGYKTQYDNASLYVYDARTLEKIASVERFAPEGEGATAVRFEGDKLYVCTAEVIEYTDPVYFFDLSDYNSIVYANTEFIDGFSTSLIDMGEGYLLGIGKEDAETNKLEVYKRDGDKVISVDKYLFGGNISDDYKSFLIDREENLFGVFVKKYTKDSSAAKDSFLVVRLEGENLVSVMEIDVQESVSITRAFAHNGYVYFTHHNALYVREINGAGEKKVITNHKLGAWVEVAPAVCGRGIIEEQACSCGRVSTKSFNGSINHQLSDGICTVCGEDVGSAEKNNELLIFTSNGDGTCVVTGSKTALRGILEIPKKSPKGDTVVGIGRFAFTGSGIETVVIPKTVRFIGDGAFYLNSILTTVIIDGMGEDGFIDSIVDKIKPSQLNEIGDEAFGYCESLKEMVIPDGVTEIGAKAFGSCDLLERVKLPASLTKISTGLFNLCKNLSGIEIPEGVTEIEEYAFNNCHSVSMIKIPDSVTKIGRRAFGDCQGLISVELGRSVTDIHEEGFVDCDAIIQVINNSSLDVVAGSADHGQVALYALSVTKGESKLVNVGDYVFYISDGNSMLVAYTGSDTELVLPDCPTGKEYEIGARAFKGMKDLTEITIPEGVTAIGHEAFRDCTGLASVTLPDSVRVISDKAFLNCNFTSFDMGDGVVSIGEWAFRGCGSLVTIHMSEKLESIGKEAFSSCYKVDLTIPDTVREIGDGAFSGCFALTKAVIPEGINVIGRDVFNNCKSLVSVVIPVSVVEIQDAFYACRELKTVYYKGTQADWERITLDYNNGLFDDVRIVYNYK